MEDVIVIFQKKKNITYFFFRININSIYFFTESISTTVRVYVDFFH